MKKVVALVLTAVVTSSILAGCTSKKTDGAVATDDKSPVTLKMFIADTVMQKKMGSCKNGCSNIQEDKGRHRGYT